MYDGYLADQYGTHALLAAVINRLGDSSGEPLKIPLPKLLRGPKPIAAIDKDRQKEELAMARELFTKFCEKRGGGNG